MEDRAFGDLLREFRVAAELSQEALAERSRLSTAAISALERNLRRGPQQQTLVLLADALALSPDKRAQLERSARDGRRRKIKDPGARAAFPASVVTGATNVARALTSFHGRENELGDLDRLLRLRRFVSLVGPGGVGKTRLARECAFRHVADSRFGDGVWFVDLTPVGDAESVASAIAHALGIAEAAGVSTFDRVRSALAQKRLLLVLDNCEHIVHDVAIVAEALVRDAAGIVLLTTTREALRADGESVMRVDPLRTEPNGTPSPAVDLFLDRLADADYPTYARLTEDQVRVAHTICRRLDGLPLALELAAGRAGELPLEHIGRSIDERFPLLSDGRRTAASRHQTLYDTIRWSFDLLDPDEQTVFVRLGVFPDTFAADAAADVCGEDVADVAGVLAGLVAKSLLGFAGRSEAALRYRLLESTRAFALQRLRESGTYERSARAFIDAFLARAKDADASFGWIPKSDFVANVEPDLENYRAALELSLGHEYDIRAGAELAGSMGWIFRQNSLFKEGERWATRALSFADDLEPRTVGRLNMATTYYSFAAGAMKESLAQAQAAAAAYRASGAHAELAWALTHTAYAAFRLSDADLVLSASAEAVSLARGLHDDYRLGGALNAFALSIPLEDPARLAVLEEAIACYRACGSHDSIVPTAHVAAAYHDADAFDKALAYGRDVVEMARASRDRSTLAAALANFAAYALSVDDLDLAYTSAHEALILVRDLGKTIACNCALQHLGSVAVRRGAFERGARLLGASTAMYRHFGYDRELTEQRSYDAAAAIIRREAGAEILTRYHRQGEALTIEAAIAEGLAVEQRAHT